MSRKYCATKLAYKFHSQSTETRLALNNVATRRPFEYWVPARLYVVDACGYTYLYTGKVNAMRISVFSAKQFLYRI